MGNAGWFRVENSLHISLCVALADHVRKLVRFSLHKDVQGVKVC